jgi:hypothetical protein
MMRRVCPVISEGLAWDQTKERIRAIKRLH